MRGIYSERGKTVVEGLSGVDDRLPGSDSFAEERALAASDPALDDLGTDGQLDDRKPCEIGPGCSIQNRSPAQCHDRVLTQGLSDGFALPVPELGLTELVEDCGNGTVGGNNAGISVYERELEQPGKSLTRARLSRTGRTDEHDCSARITHPVKPVQ